MHLNCTADGLGVVVGSTGTQVGNGGKLELAERSHDIVGGHKCTRGQQLFANALRLDRFQLGCI